MEKLNVQDLERAVKALGGIKGGLVERAVLSDAFELVSNKQDWRGPINASVHVGCCNYEPEILNRAVQYFTATDASIEEKDDHYVVRAAGYRAGPAGDH